MGILKATERVVIIMSIRTFYTRFRLVKPLAVLLNIKLSIIELEKAADKQIRYYSSGMKQRIKLAQAVFTDMPLLLLDEPCTNLDEKGYALYYNLIEQYCNGKTIIISSNDKNEYQFCKERINIIDYKQGAGKKNGEAAERTTPSAI